MLAQVFLETGILLRFGDETTRESDIDEGSFPLVSLMRVWSSVCDHVCEGASMQSFQDAKQFFVLLFIRDL